MKSKDMTTQMKALTEYIIMVVLMLLLNTVHVFAKFYVQFGQRNTAVKELGVRLMQLEILKVLKRQARGLVG